MIQEDLTKAARKVAEAKKHESQCSFHRFMSQDKALTIPRIHSQVGLFRIDSEHPFLCTQPVLRADSNPRSEFHVKAAQPAVLYACLLSQVSHVHRASWRCVFVCWTITMSEDYLTQGSH